MNLKNLALSIAFAAMSVMTAAANNDSGLRVENLGLTNSLIRIDEPKKYLLLPVEDNAPETPVRILVNAEYVKTFNIRLALNRIDYYVPLELAEYGDAKIILDVRANERSEFHKNISEDVWNTNLKLSDTFDTTNTEKFRPVYHHTPLYAWMNDPNGMFYKDGEWHLYYQYGPYGSTWNNMTWGHSVSRDLINWEHRPNAIEPNGLGMIFSGSCVVDAENTSGFGNDAVIAIYTSADRSQVQSLAYSNDSGNTFTNYAGNPIITAPQECRDPNMFWHKPSQRWIMVLAAAQAREIWIYSSPDLINWTKESSFGNHGELEGVWECPDLMELPVAGTDETKWVLICNINPGGPFGGSATQYFVGNFDGHKFECIDSHTEAKWLDYGKDHYAAVSWSGAPDGRHTLIAWMNNWLYANIVPTKQFRSANTLPRDVSLFRTEDGEYYVASVPSPEVTAARGKVVEIGSFTAKSSPKNIKIPANCQGACEIELQLDDNSTAAVEITLANSKGEKVVMNYDLKELTFAMDRTNSGMVNFNPDFVGKTVAPTYEGKQGVRLFIDSSSIEAFGAEGRFSMTNLVFPDQPYSTISIKTDGGKCKVEELNIYPIKNTK